MKIFTIKKHLRQYLSKTHAEGKTIGLVPTMGALHQGHLSLLKQARQVNDIVVCSIFVNPTQFDDPKDLEKYPRTIAADTAKLQQADCDALFDPAIKEIYDSNKQWHLNIGGLEHLLEGKFRPGHYQGVMQIVAKLFDIIKPDTAFFGQKDYQQFLIISKMTELLNIPVKLVMCPIQREPDGLALSSRNIHLTAYDREHALVLSKTLNWVKDNFDSNNIPAIKQEAELMISNEPGVQLEYLEIADKNNLHPANQKTKAVIVLAAARVGQTRLIDNVIL